MSNNQLIKDIGDFLKVKVLGGNPGWLKFNYSWATSVENTREIHVIYETNQTGGDLSKRGTCVLPIVRNKSSNGSNSHESYMYLKVFPGEKQIYKDNRIIYIKVGPSYIHMNENFLVLEDLTVGKYESINGHTGMDLKLARAALKKMAVFHAASIKYLEVNNSTDFIPSVPPLIINEDVEKRMAVAIGFIERYLPEFEEITAKLRSYLETFRKRLTDLLLKRNFPFKVIALGDASIKNMLHGLDEDSVPEVVFRNFNACFVGSVGYDLNIFFNTSLRLEECAIHRYELLRFYYKVLEEELIEMTRGVPSWQTIVDEVRKFELIGYYALLCEMPTCFVNDNFKKWFVVDKSGNSVIKDGSFEEDYEALFKNEEATKLLKYGLERFYELCLRDDRTEEQNKQEDTFGFVKL